MITIQRDSNSLVISTHVSDSGTTDEREHGTGHSVPQLPIEIVEQILHEVAIDSKHDSESSERSELFKDVLKWLQTSRWIYRLLRRYVYHTVQLQTETKASKFLYTITHNPELCQLVIDFELRDAHADLVPEWSYPWERMAKSLTKVAPTIHMGMQIMKFLLGPTQAGQNGAAVDPNAGAITIKASNLQSMIIHGDYLFNGDESTSNPFQQREATNRSQLLLPPMLTITGTTKGSYIGGWDLTRVRKLRFTSSLLFYHHFRTLVNRQICSNLTHLSIHSVITARARAALDGSTEEPFLSPSMQKLVLFSPVNPRGNVISRVKCLKKDMNMTSTNIDSAMIRLFNIPQLTLDSFYRSVEQLSDIVDDRLVLIHSIELPTAHKLSNEKFWSCIELL